MRFHVAALAAAVMLGSAASAAAQGHVRIMVNAGQQTSTTSVKQTLTFQQYVEQGSLTLERTIPKKTFYDGGIAVRLVKGLHAGVSFSVFDAKGSGQVTAQVPHPFFFNQPRRVTGTATGVNRTETAMHIQASWTAAAAGGIEITAFGGPTVFQIEQVLITRLNLAVTDEVFPYDSLTYTSAATETLKDSVKGYNAGIDMTWRFSRHLGVGALVRYSHGQKDFTPTGGQATRIEVGGLHAGGGLRLMF